MMKEHPALVGPCPKESSSRRRIFVLHVKRSNETDRQCSVVGDESDLEHELTRNLAQGTDRFLFTSLSLQSSAIIFSILKTAGRINKKFKSGA